MPEQRATPERDVFNSDCPARAIFEHITSRWATLIITALHEGPMRFYELRDLIGGISEKMLSQNLRRLVEDGLIERTVTPSTPPMVSYELTVMGRDLAAPLYELRMRIGAHFRARAETSEG